MRIGLAAFVLTTLVGCKDDHEIHRNTTEELFYQELAAEADILFVIDDSHSMADEQLLVADGFQGFIGALIEEDLDWRVAVTTTNMDKSNEAKGHFVGDTPWLEPSDDGYIAEFVERVQVGIEGSDKEQGLKAARHALTDAKALEVNGDFHRETAALALIFVSDENDCSNDATLQDDADGGLCYEYDDALIPVKEIINDLRGVVGLEGRMVASGIVGPMAKDGCDGSWPGHRYMTVAEKLDGLVGDICQSDYTDVMEDLGSRIAGPIYVFQLGNAALDGSIVVTVDEEYEVPEDDDDGFTYDSEYWQVRFDGDYVPPPGSEIRISYTITSDQNAG